MVLAQSEVFRLKQLTNIHWCYIYRTEIVVLDDSIVCLLESEFITIRFSNVYN